VEIESERTFDLRKLQIDTATYIPNVDRRRASPLPIFFLSDAIAHLFIFALRLG
jgi:hypothetical protein